MNMFQKSDPKTKEQDAIKRESYRRIQRETYGLNVKQLKQWSKDRMKEELTTELAKQQIAVSKVRTFLDAIGSSTTFNLLSDTFASNVVSSCSNNCSSSVVVENDETASRVLHGY